MINEQELWSQVKALLKSSNSDQTYKELFEPITEIHKVQNNIVYLIVNTKLDKFRIDKYYLQTINNLVSNCTKENIRFQLIARQEIPQEEEKDEKAEVKSEQNQSMQTSVITLRSLRSDYTFENFITGEANREAFTLAMKVAESCEAIINPFYIFGDVGLGKTHLMTAVGHYIYAKKQNAKIVYTTAQQFVEDYFKSKNKNQKNTALADEFDNYYRSADVLLVDDIQYLADRQGSQDEFFKLFEYLFERNKQIIITSDRPATELNIMARLKSRFTWGLQSIIRKPNLLLRKAILKQKLTSLVSDPTEINDEIITYIAEAFDQNVRELEGALRRFVTYCVSFNIPFTMDNAILALDAIIPKEKQEQNEINATKIEKIKETIASYYNINVKELSSPSRKQEYVYARSMSVYILKTKYNLTLNKIGSVLGGRDHATVSHALDKITENIKTDQFVKEDLENLIRNLDKIYED